MDVSTTQPPLLQRMDISPSHQESLAELKQLVQETCQHPQGSPQRQRGLTQLIRIMTRQLWQSSAVYYPDALQQTWIYFCRNLCEATTAKAAYDPDTASPITWLNAYLKRRLQDFEIAENRKRATTVSAFITADDEALSPIDRLPAPPDIPPWLSQIKAWVEGNAELDNIHISKHPQVTAKVLILRRLPPETPWKILSAEYGISVGTLSSFYQRQCLSKLRDYGKSQGYL
jgi:hypothetical protein